MSRLTSYGQTLITGLIAGADVPTGGNGSCNYGSADYATSTNGTIGSLVYRCVR